jgi:hypothetical protein
MEVNLYGLHMGTHMLMASKNIAIRKDVYDALRREQRAGESFSKAIARLVQQGGSPTEVGGAWPLSARPAMLRRFRDLRRT